MIEFRVERPLWTDSVEIYARTTGADGRPAAIVADGIKIVEQQEGYLWPKFLAFPMMDNAGQSLFDALWKAGFRPHNGESSVAHVDALKNHLEDMRTLVFKEKA